MTEYLVQFKSPVLQRGWHTASHHLTEAAAFRRMDKMKRGSERQPLLRYRVVMLTVIA